VAKDVLFRLKKREQLHSCLPSML